MKYEITKHGFVLHLDATIYARPAVMKAFYRLQEHYIISYERNRKNLAVFFDRSSERSDVDVAEEIREIMSELSFEMIRYDAMKQTSNLRELLVGRALYATCVDIGRARGTVEKTDIDNDSWLLDEQHIFDSWTEDI